MRQFRLLYYLFSEGEISLLNLYPTIKTFAYLPDWALNPFRKLSSIPGSSFEIHQILNEEYIKAASEVDTPRIVFKQGTSITTQDQADRVYIITSIDSTDGSKIVLSFIQNRIPDRQPWELRTAIAEIDYNNEHYIDLGYRPKEMLINYAYWPSFPDDLKFLKNQHALEENWSYIESPTDDDFPILKNYIIYTFSKLWRDKQVFIGVDGRYSVFNTGLVNRNYKYIYALFEKNIGDKPWKFNEFCIPGVRQGGRILAENFQSLPRPAHYFNDISDISYIIDFDKSPDEQLPELQPDHYFIDHPERLPMHFLLDGCRKNTNILDLLKQDISKYGYEQIKRHWATIGEMICSDAEVYEDLESSFRNAVRKAVMRVSWNYRTAIPVYFPKNNKMSILLPLTFSNSSNAEVALVVERNSVSRKYTAPTILGLPVAYSNARLVCKPESDWLNQRVFETTTDNAQFSDEDS